MKETNKLGQYFAVDSVAAFMVILIHHNKQSYGTRTIMWRRSFLRNLEINGYTNIDAYVGF